VRYLGNLGIGYLCEIPSAAALCKTTIVRNTFGSSFAKFMISSWTIEGYLQQRPWEKVPLGDTFSDTSDALWRNLVEIPSAI